jgi:hypothetical protein
MVTLGGNKIINIADLFSPLYDVTSKGRLVYQRLLVAKGEKK